MVDEQSRLSGIETLWSVVRRAHGDSDFGQARAQLLEQYGGAVRRYLRAALREEDAADEVFQNFAVRFVQGDFKNADPDRGRFRSYIKTALYRLIVDHHRRKTADRRHQHLAEFAEADQPMAMDQSDASFDESWRSELLAKAWTALEQHETDTGKPSYSVLRLRADRTELRSQELAQELSKQLGRQITSANARVMLHRAREVFSEALLTIVQQSLADSSIDRLEDELIALDLHDYCRQTLDRMRQEPEK